MFGVACKALSSLKNSYPFPSTVSPLITAIHVSTLTLNERFFVSIQVLLKAEPEERTWSQGVYLGGYIRKQEEERRTEKATAFFRVSWWGLCHRQQSFLPWNLWETCNTPRIVRRTGSWVSSCSSRAALPGFSPLITLIIWKSSFQDGAALFHKSQ